MEYELWTQPCEDIVELIAIHLDMDGADRCAVSHDAEIADEMLDRVVGKQRDPIVTADAALSEEGRDTAREVVQLSVADGAPVLHRYDPRLVRMARSGAADPVLQQLGAGVY